jgi:hypothetical protein
MMSLLLYFNQPTKKQNKLVNKKHISIFVSTDEKTFSNNAGLHFAFICQPICPGSQR